MQLFAKDKDYKAFQDLSLRNSVLCCKLHQLFSSKRAPLWVLCKNITPSLLSTKLVLRGLLPFLSSLAHFFWLMQSRDRVLPQGTWLILLLSEAVFVDLYEFIKANHLTLWYFFSILSFHFISAQVQSDLSLFVLKTF